MSYSIEEIKFHFPTYKITDASNRTSSEITKIADICIENDNVLVYIRRTTKSNGYFQLVELMERMTPNTITALFLNKDDYYYIVESNSQHFLIHLQKVLSGDIECPICYEECYNNYLFCSKCGTKCCVKCFKNLQTKSCSVCRHPKFTAYGIVN
jgi:hypothetical protein